jgi:hypothetical protein
MGSAAKATMTSTHHPLRPTARRDTLNVQEQRKMEPSQAVRPMFFWTN